MHWYAIHSAHELLSDEVRRADYDDATVNQARPPIHAPQTLSPCLPAAQPPPAHAARAAAAAGTQGRLLAELRERHGDSWGPHCQNSIAGCPGRSSSWLR